ncbi:hypothetical protein MMC24_004515 [Lignoscripta atroalba]|nr:hypothetical protein [Lignoscripta atroalba]
MVESLLPVLCDKWTWDPNQWCTTKFNKNGTGEVRLDVLPVPLLWLTNTAKLFCRVEFSLFIATEFDWKAQSNLENEPNFPATIDIDMTLTKRNTNTNHQNLIIEDVLEDAAFQPKTYRLRLEKGSFLVTGRTSYGSNPVYKYRLLWDKSPYPPLKEWKKKGPAMACKFWERNDFYRGQIEA